MIFALSDDLAKMWETEMQGILANSVMTTAQIELDWEGRFTISLLDTAQYQLLKLNTGVNPK